MADIEKIIKELKDGLDFKIYDNTCVLLEVSTVSNAFELLKEYQKTVHCKDCKWSWCLNPNDESPFYVCRHPTLCNMRMSHEGNWYCGNGELKDGEHK